MGAADRGLPHPRPRARHGRGRGRGPAAPPVRQGRLGGPAAARHARLGQGPDPDGGHPDHPRLPAARRRRARPRRSGRGPAAGRGGGGHRQDQHHRGRVERGRGEPAAGADAQSVGSRPHPRRLERRCGRLGGRGHRRGRHRHRRRRVDPHPRVVLRGRRVQALAGPDPVRAAEPGGAVPSGAADPDGGRRGPAHAGDVRLRRGRSAVLRGPRRADRGPGGRGRAAPAAAHRLDPLARRSRAAARHRGRRPAGGRGAGRPGAHGRGDPAAVRGPVPGAGDDPGGLGGGRPRPRPGRGRRPPRPRPPRGHPVRARAERRPAGPGVRGACRAAGPQPGPDGAVRPAGHADRGHRAVRRRAPRAAGPGAQGRPVLAGVGARGLHLQPDRPARGVRPGGTLAGGLPVGLQLVGGRHEDLRVLAAAYQVEQARPWHHRYAALTAQRPETEGEPT